MKKFKHIAGATSLLITLISSSVFAAKLVVVVDNIKDVQGSLYVSLYNKEANFETNEKALKRQKVSVDKTTISVNFGDLPAGEYAVKAYQDVNSSGGMDFNGPMPAEPFGSSSNSKELAPPSYNKAKFILDKNQQVQIHLLK